MATTFISNENLNTQQFTTDGGSLNLKLSPTGNITATAEGLGVNVDNAVSTAISRTNVYYLNLVGSNVRQETTGGVQQRRMLTVFPDKMGVFNLDFTPTVAGRVHLFNLPDNAPTPRAMIAFQTHYGALLWIEANSRAVMGSGLNTTDRVICTLIGLFN